MSVCMSALSVCLCVCMIHTRWSVLARNSINVLTTSTWWHIMYSSSIVCLSACLCVCLNVSVYVSVCVCVYVRLSGTQQLSLLARDSITASTLYSNTDNSSTVSLSNCVSLCPLCVCLHASVSLSVTDGRTHQSSRILPAIGFWVCFVGDVGRLGATSSHVKNLTAQTWRSTRGWSLGIDPTASTAMHSSFIEVPSTSVYDTYQMVDVGSWQYECPDGVHSVQ